MKKYGKSLGVGGTLFVLGVFASLSGYHYVLIYASFFIVCCLLILSTCATRKNAPLFEYICNTIIITLLFILGVGIGLELLVRRKIEVCERSEKIISKLNKYKKENGVFPNSLLQIDLKNVDSALNMKIKEGKFEDGGVNLDGYNDHELIVYLDAKEYLLVVPVTKKLLMSITRMYAFMRNDKSDKWEYDMIIWTLSINR
ncbi:MAG: hypothetical protein AABZ60_13355 [Planctomycetota bacterium]